MTFVIFHGAFSSPESNWFPELKEKLEALGQKVIAPQFPVDSFEEITKNSPNIPPRYQSLRNWLATFEKKVLPKIEKREKLCFIGHSLSPVFILHVVDRYNLCLDCAIFVCPFLKLPNKSWQYYHVNKTFYKTDFDFKKLKKLIPLSYVLYSDNDPYVDKKYPLDFAKKINSSLIYVTRAGHMNSEVNLNEFPLVLELCKTRLELSLYQKYLAHRRELYAVDYLKGKSEEIIYLSPSDVFDEGVFHFRNLRKSGFCTLFTGSTFWDTQSKYMIEARKAAKRVRNFIRVYMVEDIKDLRRAKLLEQIRLDLNSGINVYFCLLQKIINQIPEPDFGIWDEDYVCLVRFDRNKKANEVQLSSRKKDIKEALRWKKIILKRAIRIYNAGKDIEDFIKNQVTKF